MRLFATRSVKRNVIALMTLGTKFTPKTVNELVDW